MRKNQNDNFSWLEAELNETYDEMFEAEFSEPMLPDEFWKIYKGCLLYTSPSPRDVEESRMPSSA